jgi:hypothetical protein
MPQNEAPARLHTVHGYRFDPVTAQSTVDHSTLFSMTAARPSSILN